MWPTCLWMATKIVGGLDSRNARPRRQSTVRRGAGRQARQWRCPARRKATLLASTALFFREEVRKDLKDQLYDAS